MATPPNPLVRVSTSGTVAKCKNYSDSPATAGLVLTATGEDNVPNWAAPAGAADIKVSNIMFVDAGAVALGANGSLSHPFTSIQPAIAAMVAAGWVAGTIRLATATYIDPVAIPIGLAVSFDGWDPQAPAILGGDITITGGIGSSDLVSFTNCTIVAANITAADPLTQDLQLLFDKTFNSAAITSFNALLTYFQSTQGGAITCTGLTISWDGYSWARTLQVAPAIVPAAYTRQFFDAGHDTYQRSLTLAAVAIGTTAFQSMVVPDYVRADDFVQMQVLDPSVRDFICGVHGVDAGAVVVWLTNLSRVSTDFDEAILLLVHHEAMVAEPPP
jgi:hypothetical protein